ncbi:MAG: single-stranded DNA-binding protein [Atopobiaceae bacterium]|nr:single-stranded DNA-binding protein [Atopobiaceae bacterium]MBR3384959.1 single-stranded DNA-binding protein [Atopobiaceae bacterium]
MSINRVNISGNLTRDPELRTTQGGTAVLGFGVAVNDRRRNPQTGEWEDVPNFIDCTVFGNRAGALANFLRKCQKVAIEGKLRWSQWEKDGQKRSKIEVIVDECEFLAPRQDGQQQGYPQQAPQGYAPQPPAPQYQRPQAPQYAPQGYQNPPAQGYGQNQAPQAPSAPAYQQPAQQPPAQAYQPTLPQQAPQVPQMEVYDEDIPF